TASIGDPSGRSTERPVLSLSETKAHAQTYFDQAGLLINMAAAEVHYNSHWLQPMTLEEVLRLARVTTVARMLERDDFAKRHRAEKPISIAEFLYPLAQGYDSVQVQADIELGGTDQTFNLLLGREVQRAYGQEPQVTITLPLLPGTDGVDKMSKSADNWIGLTDKPFDKYGKIMSIPDGVMMLYYRLLTKLTPEFLEMLEDDVQDGTKHPMEAKKDLARTIVTRYHGLCTAVDVEEHWERQFSLREIPAEVPYFQVAGILLKDPLHAKVVDIMEAAGMTASKGEARRLIKQGGVQVDGIRVADTEMVLNLDQPKLIQIGRRQFLKAGL
ncbi:MAG TPA: tyrosine--tRNA ligase, partial [bacterium]|nr:tyrosine--tRNA ligase [bacterium]